MQVTIGKEGLTKSWQGEFPGATPCIHPGCDGEARIGFVAHEGMNGTQAIPEGANDINGQKLVCSLHPNDPERGFWLNDRCSVAVYFCRECLKVTALYNQR